MIEIACAAILHQTTIYHLPRPYRHHDIIRLMYSFNVNTKGNETKGQGFLTNTGRFVGRIEAAIIAQNANQIIVKHGPKHILFSEDVW